MTPHETHVAQLLADSRLHKERATEAGIKSIDAIVEAQNHMQEAAAAISRSIEFRHQAEAEQEEAKRLVAEVGKLVLS